MCHRRWGILAGRGTRAANPTSLGGVLSINTPAGAASLSRLFFQGARKAGPPAAGPGRPAWVKHTALLLGTTATRADATGQTIEIIEREIRRLAEEGPTEAEFAKARTYLKGSFALGLDTSSRIASQLVQMQLDNLGIDYIER